jgi:hypothetical protein
MPSGETIRVAASAIAIVIVVWPIIPPNAASRKKAAVPKPAMHKMAAIEAAPPYTARAQNTSMRPNNSQVA